MKVGLRTGSAASTGNDWLLLILFLLRQTTVLHLASTMSRVARLIATSKYAAEFRIKHSKSESVRVSEVQ